jgi:hypothetical protein
MARIDLRNCTIYLKDGLTGAAKANKTLTPDKTAVAQGDTTCKVSDVNIPGARGGLTEKIPIGARFTIAGETAKTVHVVTQRTLSGDETTDITFSPALGAGTYATDAAVTFQPQQIEIKIGEGDLKYTEADEYKYDKDRGLLDTVRKGDDVPMEVSTNFTFDQVKSGTGEVITPIEAIKGVDAAAEWVTSSADSCEPYAVDVIVDDVRPCGSAETATYTFPDFRSEKRDYDLKNANIAVSGKCNATEPIITRGS